MGRGDDYLKYLKKSLSGEKETIPHFTVEGLLKDCGSLQLTAVAGHEGIDRQLSSTKVQLLGLALAGFTDDLEANSVQILGKAELRFIQEQITENPPEFFEPEFECGIGCFVVPEALDIPKVFIQKANQFGIPVLTSPMSHRRVESFLSRVLEAELAPSTSVHGGLVVVCGLGILILGPSGIGKTDCALDLITHGHQFVADDVVSIRRNPLGRLIGKAKEPVRHHMDVRGLGIVNVKELFSIYSVMDEHSLDLVILLEPWDDKETYVTSHDDEALNILGVDVPIHRLPISTGRNWVNLIQVAVRKHILRSGGYNAEQLLMEKFEHILKMDRP